MASFVSVPPASPSIVRSGPASPETLMARRQAVSTLFAKKKKTAPPSSKKIFVKLTKTIPGVGQKNDILSVSPQLFQNKYQRNGSAVRVTEEEVEEEKIEEKNRQFEMLREAEALKDELEQFELNIPKKAGPNGHIFGSVTSKFIMSELKNKFPNKPLDKKYVKVKALQNQDNKDMKHDIKVLGEYKAKISLLKDVEAVVRITVSAES